MLDTVTSSCLQVGVIMVNKYAKFQSHISMDFENISGITKTLNYVNSQSKKDHNSVKMHDTVTPSCLQVGVVMVNKCAKFQSNMSMDFENISGITKTLNYVNS
jgi:uncharacterized lipoprotein YehR (DUF1307 family)